MKDTLLFLGAFLLISTFSFGQGTTLDEYNYITKGYKIQMESGLDMKKGYTMKDLNSWSLKKGTENREVRFQGLYRTGQTKACAILMQYKRTDINNGANYFICIPSNTASEEIWKLTLNFLNENIKDNDDLSKTMIWALMHLSSEFGTN